MNWAYITVKSGNRRVLRTWATTLISLLSTILAVAPTTIAAIGFKISDSPLAAEASLTFGAIVVGIVMMLSILVNVLSHHENPLICVFTAMGLPAVLMAWGSLGVHFASG